MSQEVKVFRVKMCVFVCGQYEKGKPLVNLVDNMVKLGSLYREGVSPYSGGLDSPSAPNVDPLPLRQRLEFNHQVQEQRLLAEERRDWDRLSLDHSQLQVSIATIQIIHPERDETN